MKIKFLIDSLNFWESLKKDIHFAKKSIYIQTYSLEGDQTGKNLADSLISSKALEKKIIIDAFINYFINDKFIFSPKNLFFNNSLKQEINSTKYLLDYLKKNSVEIKFTKFNHKKIIIIDNKISYIGGNNFTDHNFAWHDLMVRIEDGKIANFLTPAFIQTWEEKNISSSVSFNDIKIINLDSKNNQRYQDEIFNLIENAQHSIFIQSPHITFPFLNKIKKASKRGVKVTIISTEYILDIIKNYIKWECSLTNIKLWYYQNRKTHLKSILIDDKYLIVGSSNFDFLSYKIAKEIIAIIPNPDAIRNFQKQVIIPDIKNSKLFEGYRCIIGFRRFLLNLQLKILGNIIVFFTRL